MLTNWLTEATRRVPGSKIATGKTGIFAEMNADKAFAASDDVGHTMTDVNRSVVLVRIIWFIDPDQLSSKLMRQPGDILAV